MLRTGLEDGGLGHGRRYRRAPQARERFLHLDWQRPLRLVRHDRLEEPGQFPGVAAPGQGDYLINPDALAYMRGRSLADRSSACWLTIATSSSPIGRRGRPICSGSASPLSRFCPTGADRHRRGAVGQRPGPRPARRDGDRQRRRRPVKCRPA